MPHSKQAKKRLRQSFLNRQRNDRRKNAARTLTKRVRSLVAAKKAPEAAKLLPNLYQALDKAAKTNVIHKNTAARSKSRLSKLVASAQANTQPTPKQKSTKKGARKPKPRTSKKA